MKKERFEWRRNIKKYAKLGKQNDLSVRDKHDDDNDRKVIKTRNILIKSMKVFACVSLNINNSWW